MKWKNIIMKTSEGEILYEGSFSEMPIKEDYVIAKSIELYKEEEPCIIYRTHIAKKLYLDILDAFGCKPTKGLVVDCNEYLEVMEPLALEIANTTIEFK